MVISHCRPEDTRDRSLHRVQGFLTSAVAGSSETGGNAGSRSNVCENRNINVSRRGRSTHASSELQDIARTNCFDRGSELLSGEHHSGLESYERHLSSLEEASIHNHFHQSMEISGFPIESDVTQNPLDSASLFGVDNSLESYGRYLGSSSELGYYRDSNQTDSLTNLQETNRNGNHGLHSGSLSDYAGLGRYSQPSFESTDFGFSRELQTENSKFTNYGGYGGGLF